MVSELREMIGEDRLARGLYWGKAWSLVGGCTHVSAACAHCWAESWAARWSDTPFYARLTDESGHWSGAIRCREDVMDKPIRTKTPTVWAIWTDLYHEGVPFDFRLRAWRVMERCSHHRFLVLTKRAERMAGDSYVPAALPNVAMGVTAEHQRAVARRLPYLLMAAPTPRFVSCEPLLGGVDLGPWLPRLDWVVVGCESGPNRRPTDDEWVRRLVQQCRGAGVPVFVKQIEVAGRVSHDPSEWPEDLRVRQLPWTQEEGDGER